MAGNSLLVLRILLIWPAIAAVGLASVAGLNAVIADDRVLSEVNDATGFTVVTWFIAPALHWLVLPREWGPPRFAIWTLANGGIAVFTVFAVQAGIFFYYVGVGRLLDPSLEDIAHIAENITTFNAAATLLDLVGAALIPLAVAVGYVAGCAMMSWRLALLFVGASMLGAVATYFYLPDIIVPFDLRFAPAGPTAYPMALAALVAAISGLFGAAALVLWGLLGAGSRDELEWQDQ